SGFLSAVGMTLILWSFYFAYKGILYKGLRKQSIAIALALFALGGVVLPSPNPSKPSVEASHAKISAQNTSEEELRKKEELEQKQAAKKAAEEKERRQKEELAQ